MKSKVLKILSAIVGSLLVLLGFESCDKEDNTRVEYGVPHASFRFTGIVVDKDGGAPIEGIPVQAGETGERWYNEPQFTDHDGYFSVEAHIFPIDPMHVTFTINDEGSGYNDRYVTITRNYTFYREDLEGGSGWYEGGVEADLGKIILEEILEENAD